MEHITYALLLNNSVSSQYKIIIEKEYNEISGQFGDYVLDAAAYVNEFSNSFDSSLPDISLGTFVEKYFTGEISTLLIPIDNLIGANYYISTLLYCNVNLEDVYFLPRYNPNGFSSKQLTSLLSSYYETKYLPYLEFHVADHCNLNCAYCEHYSGLVEKEIFTDFSTFNNDLRKLHEFIEDIGQIRILGGEPLLNPQIEAYVGLVRDIYPLSNISIVTNGLLLFTMKPSFFETLKRNSTEISISYYPPLEKRKAELEEMLSDYKVAFNFTPLIKEFTIKQSLEPSENVQENFMKCVQSRCNNLYQGHIAACFLPFTTKYFNSYFKENLPEDGAVDLYKEGMTTEILKKSLLTPFERCRYCRNPINAKWRTIQLPSVLEDWIQ